MKKILLFMTIASTLLMYGCTKEVSKEEFIDEAVVKSASYQPSYTTTSIVPAGKAVIPVTNHHPAVYRVEVEYRGVTYKENNKACYEKLKGKIGYKIKCKFTKTYYDDNTSKINLLDIEDVE